MISTLLSDFSQVLLFPKNPFYLGSLNALFKEKSGDSGFSFFEFYSLNTELLDFYQQVKDKHKVEVHIFTTGTVQEHPDLQPFLQPVFDQVFTVAEMKIPKTDPLSFQTICKELAIKPEEVAFIDDSLRNIEAAQTVGLHGILYNSNDQAKRDILTLLQ